MGVLERPKGSGIYWASYTDQFGHRRREKAGSKSLARKVYNKRKEQIREGKFFPENLNRKQQVLFRDMVKTYLEEHSKVNKRSYVTDCHNSKRLVETFGDNTLSQITPQDIERFKAQLLEELSIATANRHLSLMNGIFNKAITWGKAETNPLSKVSKLKENNQRIRYLTEQEEERLSAAFPEEHWHMVELAYNTGLRREELFELKWSCVNFSTKTITIPRSKNGEKRHVPINDRVSEILRTLSSRFKGEYVFPNRLGVNPVNPNNFVNRVFKPALSKAGIQDFHWHDLRHTFASRLVMAGVDLRTVQELMGHKSMAMTLRYSHLSPKHTLDAVNKLCLTRKEGGTKTGTEGN